VLDACAAPAEDDSAAATISDRIATIRNLAPDAAVVALVAPGDDATARQALEAGAVRCVHKDGCYFATLLGLLDGLIYARQQIDAALDAMTAAWAGQLSLRNNEREDHLQRVTGLTLRVAQAMGVSAEELRHVRYGALLHDLGKLAVPESILAKPGPLTDDEWRMVLTHPEHARQMLAGVPHLSRAIDIPYAHHERWDGTGYPRGLRGEQIPLAARIFAVVDVWDTLCSDRPYRKRWSPDRAREHIRALAGTSFDPAVVDAFLKVLDQLD
jgi:HD-GYP domain-containing protein (c-di-GMP phosphodiesterase class II)